MKYRIGMLCLFVAFFVAFFPLSARAEVKSIYNSPYVSFSPDGKAWTVQAWDRTATWYPMGTTVSTGLTSSLRELNTGEHYYLNYGDELIPVSRWEVAHPYASCIHRLNLPYGFNYHDLAYGRNICYNHYYSGWYGYCADCGERFIGFVYMSAEAAGTIQYVPADTEFYYMCPWCSNLEQGASATHRCKKISCNQYLVRYNPNAFGTQGTMPEDRFLYGNGDTFEGRKVEKKTTLTQNRYTRDGFAFAGWNTRPDGTGDRYADEAEVLNLTEENWESGSSKGIVTLYAQWEVEKSILRIDPNGGSYLGSEDTTNIKSEFGGIYTIEEDALIPPNGYTARFDSAGGLPVADIIGKEKLEGWVKSTPFYGYLDGDTYYFSGALGSVDTVTASYEEEPILLPPAERPGFSFGGWYYDSTCTTYAGGAGTAITLDRDRTFTAKWEESIPALTLTATLTRVLAPHTPIFKGGESGRLEIISEGYPERITVEFPPALSELNKTFTYTGSDFSVTETMDFVIPLFAAGGDYLPVKVTSYRGEEKVSKVVTMAILDECGGVLLEFRTRLR